MKWPHRKRNTCPASSQSQEKNFVCVCGRSFRRQGDLTRHQGLDIASPGYTKGFAIMALRAVGSFKVQGSKYVLHQQHDCASDVVLSKGLGMYNETVCREGGGGGGPAPPPSQKP